MFVTMLSTTKPSYAIHSLASFNTTIENNTIDVPNTQYGYGLYVTANTLVKNNTLNNIIRINGQNDTVIDNTVNTTMDSAITLTNSAANAIIANNTLYAAAADGDLAISNVLNTTTVEGNIPSVYTFTVTNDNYTSYFNDDATLKTDVVTNGSQIIFSGEIFNKSFIFDNVKVLVKSDATAKLYNTTITTKNNAQVSFDGLKIDNTDSEGYVILLDSENNKIKNSVINVTSTNAVQIIKIEQDKNTVQNTTINATIPLADAVYNADWSIGNVPSAGMFIRSSDNYINNTKIWIYADSAVDGTYYPTIDGMDIQSKAVGEFVTNNVLYNTRINVTSSYGNDYVYGLNVARAKDISTSLTYYIVNGENAVYGVQIGNSENLSIAGYVYAIAGSQADGAYLTAMATGKSVNVNMSKLYLQNISAPIVNAIEIDGASGVELSNATYTVSGDKVTVIKAASDWMENKPENIFINALKITSTSTSDDSLFISIVNATNVTITNSNMSSTSGKGINLADVNDAVVKNNFINAGNMIGGDAAVLSNKDAVIENNTPTIAVLTDETYSNFFDENGYFISDAKILSLAGDLHNKDLFFNKNQSLNFTNTANYTIYNGTIMVEGLSTVYNSTLGTITLNVLRINFNNTNKPVFVDKLNGTIQRNVKFANSTIYATGDDIVVFDAFNNESYVYLDVSYSNITAEADNVIVYNYAGYNRGQPGYMNYNNINVTAENEAIVLKADKATIQVNYNNITQKAQKAITVDAQNSTISYSSFIYNNIKGEADVIMALNFTKADTSIAYIQYNNITFNSTNPVTAINITGNRTPYVTYNNIIVNSTNNGQPVIYVNAASSSVQNNYILAKDTAGNDAVENSGTTSSNRPSVTQVQLKDIDGAINTNTIIKAEVTTTNGTKITSGTVEFTDAEGNIIGVSDVTDGQASVTVKYNKAFETQITATYVSDSDDLGSQKTSTLTIKASVETTIVVEEFTANAGQTVNITATIEDSNANLINGGKVAFKVNGKTLKDANGKVLYAQVVDGKATIEYEIPDSWAGKTLNVTAVYSGSSKYEAARSEATVVDVTKEEATLTITPFEESVKTGSTITLKAKVQQGTDAITSGKIVFKINGKTIKDENGKVIYAKLDENGEVSVDYNIGTLKARSYTVEAIFTSSGYETLNANTTLTVVKN